MKKGSIKKREGIFSMGRFFVFFMSFLLTPILNSPCQATKERDTETILFSSSVTMSDEEIEDPITQEFHPPSSPKVSSWVHLKESDAHGLGAVMGVIFVLGLISDGLVFAYGAHPYGEVGLGLLGLWFCATLYTGICHCPTPRAIIPKRCIKEGI